LEKEKAQMAKKNTGSLFDELKQKRIVTLEEKLKQAEVRIKALAKDHKA